MVDIAPIESRDAYSNFVLKRLLPFVDTEHVLLVQWDGYVVNPGAWDPAFLDCDYLGAKWFWHGDGMRVGNGGFSLRSRRLLEALADPRIQLVEAEDTTIGRTFRPLLEREHAIRFGSDDLADKFSFEAAHPIGKPFGFHGLFNFWQVMPAAELAALPPRFSDEIARSPQLMQLLRNCMARAVWAPAMAIARRMLAADPGARRCSRAAGTGRGQRGSRRGHRPQRSLSVRQRQALQAMPRRGGRRLVCRPRNSRRTASSRAACRRINAATSMPRCATTTRRSRPRQSIRSRCITSASSTISATAWPTRCRSSSAPSRWSRRSPSSTTTWDLPSPPRTGPTRPSRTSGTRWRPSPPLPRPRTTWGCRCRRPTPA